MSQNTIQNNANSYATFGTSFGKAPRSGPRTLPSTANFTASTNPILFDLALAKSQDKLEFVQALYADNSQNAYPFSITSVITGHTITWGPYQQGFLPIESTAATQFVASTTNPGTISINVQFLNHPVPAEVWNTNANQNVNIVSTNPNYMVSGVNANIPMIKGTTSYTGRTNTGSIGNILATYNASEIPFITDLDISISGDATLATAGETELILGPYSSFVSPQYSMTFYLPSSAPANPPPLYSLLSMKGILLFASNVNTGFNLYMSPALASGYITINLMGGYTSHNASG